MSAPKNYFDHETEALIHERAGRWQLARAAWLEARKLTAPTQLLRVRCDAMIEQCDRILAQPSQPSTEGVTPCA